jgi:two-component system osmolarity sensor histidine kinase EnvZ
MASPFLKPFLPRSLFGRASLILIVPIVALQLIVALVFIQRHYEGVTDQMVRNIAREIAVALQIVETSPGAAIAQARLNNVAVPLGLTFRLDEDGTLAPANRRAAWDLSGRALIETFTALLGPAISVDLLANDKMVDLRILTADGVLAAQIPRARVSASNPHQLLVLMIFASLFLIGIAVVFLRNQIKPILDLADVSEAFGKGRSVPFRPAGAEEVRRAGSAFLSMRARLERQMEQRTLMLSGVSHDLRTPLTRIKLAAAMIEDAAESAAITRDADDMERMLDEFLAFARGDTLEESAAVNPLDLVEDIVARTRRQGAHISLVALDEAPDTATVPMKEGAIRRAVQNLVNNAVRHGTRIRLTLRLLAKTCEFVVEDNGPGIPADKREFVIRPFARLDESRNQDRGGGVGLGLSIVMDVARSHGGTLELDDSADLGGLKATLRLPR